MSSVLNLNKHFLIEKTGFLEYPKNDLHMFQVFFRCFVENHHAIHTYKPISFFTLFNFVLSPLYLQYGLVKIYHPLEIIVQKA